MSPVTETSRKPFSAFALGAVVGILGGLIGLGGAEFRLPLLVGWFRYPLRLAIVINLLVSLVTVAVSLAFRAQSQGSVPLLAQWPVALNILAGSLVGSYAAVHFSARVSERALAATVAVVLGLLGLLLITHEWVFSHEPLVLAASIRVLLGFFAGLVIGAVSSLLGVAGGELIIPTLVLLFGLDIKLAGSVSLMISIPTVIVGIARYRTLPVFQDLHSERRFILAMALGSILGAWIGSQLLPYTPSVALQILLGAILLFPAVKMARSKVHARA